MCFCCSHPDLGLLEIISHSQPPQPGAGQDSNAAECGQDSRDSPKPEALARTAMRLSQPEASSCQGLGLPAGLPRGWLVGRPKANRTAGPGRLGKKPVCCRQRGQGRLSSDLLGAAARLSLKSGGSCGNTFVDHFVSGLLAHSCSLPILCRHTRFAQCFVKYAWRAACPAIPHWHTGETAG